LDFKSAGLDCKLPFGLYFSCEKAIYFPELQPIVSPIKGNKLTLIFTEKYMARTVTRFDLRNVAPMDNADPARDIFRTVGVAIAGTEIVKPFATAEAPRPAEDHYGTNFVPQTFKNG
jgi:hypothetical protein